MSNLPSSPDSRVPHGAVGHWAALRKHWLFALLALLLGPLLGFLAAGDRGLLFGLAVGCLAGFWIWWEGTPTPKDPDRGDSAG